MMLLYNWRIASVRSFSVIAAVICRIILVISELDIFWMLLILFVSRELAGVSVYV
ncbi:hypothetical protein IGS61_05770 [Janthinobacterium sp. FW305-129]|uniref:hypothetical protein n=1 Tax=Janthinobacterium sp. FW305-129 TaxID=2775054 RepID=UPI001E4EAC9F|nr:hypothetical protein [Janthinobacterium sp. FW305-129]MCC7596983.1 hypothetical protein [Janthinobacterium sp. FW305-129]